MEAKEKAKALCEQMWLIVGGPWVDKATYNKQYDKAKQCALILVDEILTSEHLIDVPFVYWTEVKEAIEAF